MFLSLLGFILVLIVLSLLFSVFIPVFLITALVLIVTRTDLKNGLVVAGIIAFAGYLITQDVLTLTNVLMFPIIVYIFKRIEPKAFDQPIFGPNYTINLSNIIKLFVIAVVFMALGSLFSGILGWVFGISILIGLIVLIPLLIIFGILSQLVFILIIIPLMAFIKSLA
jgi:hypothetical protein